MRIVSVNVGGPRLVSLGGKQVETSIFKQSVPGRVALDACGIAGDGRAERRKFGEAHHAVSVLARAHYEHWRQVSGRLDASLGSFGENLTTDGILEDAVRIGDVWRCGTAVLQVAQPRIPCRKWRDTLGLASTRELLESRKLGFYLRVLEPGELWAEVDVALLESDAASPTVDEFIRVSQFDYWDREALRRLLGARDLMPAWRDILQEKLDRAEQAEGWLGMRPLCVARREPRATEADVVELELRCPEGRLLAPFERGQPLMVAFPSPVGAPRVRRAYPLVGDPQDLLRYWVRVDRRSLGDAASLFDGLVVGSVLRAAAPRGGTAQGMGGGT